MIGSSTLNYQSSNIYSSEIFHEHFLALFQAIGFFFTRLANFYLVAEKPRNLRSLVEKPSTFKHIGQTDS